MAEPRSDGGSDPAPPGGSDPAPPGGGEQPRAGDECGFTSDVPRSIRKLRVAALAASQFGRVRYDQMRAIGVGEATITEWHRTGYLHPELPRVYAVGHPARSTESDLAAALLYAGPGAMLSHGTAIWWLGLLKYAPEEIHVSTPRDVRSRPGIVVHPRRHLTRTTHNNLPTTSPSRALLDFAATGPANLLRLALASADYADLLDTAELHNLTGRGIAGSAALNEALQIHRPQLADTRSDGEVALLIVCEQHDLPIPDCNVYVGGWLVDAVWPRHHLVVEIDGHMAHRTRAQLERDHQRDLELRAAGYVVLRYTMRQLLETPAAVAAELARHLTG